MTGFAAAIVEAWQELRIHKLRVLLSLIGVGVAVCSLTAAVAVGTIAQQGLVEQYEKESGRPATFSMYLYSESGESLPIANTRAVFAETMDKFGIDYFSMVGDSMLTSKLGGKRRDISVRIVDPPYADMFRKVPVQGRWLSRQDADNYSPAIVVDARFLKARGLGPNSLPATVKLQADRSVTATIIGQLPKDTNSDMPTVYMLPETYNRWFGAGQPLGDASFQMWVPPKGSKALGAAVEQQLSSRFSGAQIEFSRQDYATYGGDQFREFKYVVGGIGLLILGLGALSLLNIALVTIKQRVREIGIRRSFGATSGRIFFSVMMESIVATLVAGLVGIGAAVGIVNSSLIRKELFDNVTDIPAFPISAAIIGLLVSLAVGALAGLLPALVAVRVRIIDAIRF
ncbi:ABC transporter permease [Aeromicrobium sp. P5_D10]